MGVIRWLNRIDPKVWEEACAVIIASPPGSATKARQFLERFHREPESSFDTAYDDFDDLEQRPYLLNGLLECAVTEESWDMDKALSHGLDTVLKSLPGGKIVDQNLIGFAGMKLELPDVCNAVDGGFYGAIDKDEVMKFLPVASQFRRLEYIDEVAQIPVGKFLGVFPRTNKAKKARPILNDEYFWEIWQDLCTAVETTCEKGHHLGLGMSC
jgi:hypothetical protein